MIIYIDVATALLMFADTRARVRFFGRTPFARLIDDVRKKRDFAIGCDRRIFPPIKILANVNRFDFIQGRGRVVLQPAPNKSKGYVMSA